MPSPRRLIVLRHGETDWNAARRIQGQTDIPLNERGLDQARVACLELLPYGPTHIVSSDLSRAVCTGVPLAVAADIPMHFDVRLREIAVGGWEGLHVDETETHFPEEHARWKAGDDVARGGGETRHETATRVANCLAETLRRSPVDSVVVAISHGVAVRVGLDLLHTQGLVHLDQPAPHLRNAEWMILDVVVESWSKPVTT